MSSKYVHGFEKEGVEVEVTVEVPDDAGSVMDIQKKVRITSDKRDEVPLDRVDGDYLVLKRHADVDDGEGVLGVKAPSEEDTEKVKEMVERARADVEEA
ncbi:MAG: hypothetical protein SV760_08175 [Halobacteria archaeon]|nr:hypothetical protein [Halobacteria archaeon]